MAKKSSNKKHTKQGKNDSEGGSIKQTKVVTKTSSNNASLTGISAVAVAIVAVFILRFQTKESAMILNTSPAVNATRVNPEKFTPVKPKATSFISVSIATFHDVSDESPQQADLARYLQFDDGYSTCLVKDDLKTDTFGVWQLKQTKLQYLEQIANIADRWIVQIPIQGPTPDTDLIASTCRVMSLTHEDFDAVIELKHALGTNMTLDNIYGHALEYRTMACLSRILDLSPTMLQHNQVDALRMSWYHAATAAKEAATAEPPALLQRGWTELRKPESFPHSYYQQVGSKSSTWIRPTARPGDMGAVAPKENEVRASLIVRGKPCPVENIQPLLTM
jgi:hypothetical protein